MADSAHRQDAHLALEAKCTELELEREKNKKRKLEFDAERLRIEQEDRRERMCREEEHDNRLFSLMSADFVQESTNRQNRWNSSGGVLFLCLRYIIYMAPASIKKPRAKAASGTVRLKSQRVANSATKAPRKRKAKMNLTPPSPPPASLRMSECQELVALIAEDKEIKQALFPPCGPTPSSAKRWRRAQVNAMEAIRAPARRQAKVQGIHCGAATAAAAKDTRLSKEMGERVLASKMRRAST
ncbi:hypothetical protein B0H13DRAFT_1866025 [Mycena leptocephala]|nr:hypothetical protein B0H13DRAFT_1866025 [Mycena leptocephala]